MAAECVIFAVHGSLSASANIIQNHDQRKKEAFLLNTFQVIFCFQTRFFHKTEVAFNKDKVFSERFFFYQ